MRSDGRFLLLASYTLAVSLPQFGLNRFDARSVSAFADDVKRAELLGWDAAFQPDSQLRRRDTYVLLAAAANATQRISLAPFIANPVTRHPSVTASSIATVDELAPGRVLLALGIGDTAVRLSGLRPARVAELEAATLTIKALLAGESLDVGAAQLAYLPHHRRGPRLDRCRRPEDASDGGCGRRRGVHPYGNCIGKYRCGG